MAQAALTIVAGTGGIALGAWLAWRNSRRAATDRLLVEALNDLVAAVADVAGGDQRARRRYASAMARLLLHGSPHVIDAWHEFQLTSDTGTADGRRRFIAAVQVSRRDLGRPTVDELAAAHLLFGGASESEGAADR